ncbi:putative methyltransferase [Tripterygium wilfordii]|uniref:Putative methyltransferase n=1 Tax=Tripterygium wilfordii TaxID=458696 RepID=A0A7J7D6J4_TRIWF|nr:putative methyltransferase [Tripterygium wilfordii]
MQDGWEHVGYTQTLPPEFFINAIDQIFETTQITTTLLRTVATVRKPGRVQGSSRVQIFDRELKRKQRDRAAWLMRPNDSLVDAVTENLLDRLEDCKKAFPTALCLGGSLEPVRRLLRDLVISCMGLHWTNDLPGAMIQCKLALKPDGLFLAAILGGDTLKELRIACTVAQMEREGGISPRVSPLAQVRDAGNLLTRAGFTLPGVDVDEYTVKYKNALELIEHLRAMGETNALMQRSNILRRETALATAAVYDSMFAAEDGTIPATFQVIYMTGWKEHASQQKAKMRGSATASFNDIQKQFGNDSCS